MIVVTSIARTVRLNAPAPPGCQRAVLLVSAGATDAEVLDWAACLFDPVALDELRAALGLDRPDGAA